MGRRPDHTQAPRSAISPQRASPRTSRRVQPVPVGVGQKLVRGVFVLLALWVLVTVGAVLALRWLAPLTSAVMLLEPGPVASIDYRWVERGAISSAMPRAVIAAEDQKFLDHYGVDLVELRKAIDTYRSNGELRGASTITQQVAKNLFLWNGRSFLRKGLEAYFALLIEGLWPKERILEMYLNVAEFGEGVFGVEAAAVHAFGTDASRLSENQAAILTAVLPSPKRMHAASPSDYVRTRQSEITAEIRLLEERGHYLGLVW